MTQLGPTRVLYTDEGRPRAIEGFPVAGTINSPFGPREPLVTPAGTTSDFHTGIDIGAWFGTPVWAPADGVVTFSGLDTAGGHIVTMRLEDGTGSIFVHLDGWQAAQGAQVRRGEVVGYIGSTGLSTGPHLHFMRVRQVFEGAWWYAREFLIDPLSPEGGFVEVIDVPAPPRDVAYGDWPPAGAGALVAIVADCSPEEVALEAAAEGRPLKSLWRYRDGQWVGFLVGAPVAVSGGFGPLAAGSAIYVVAAD